MIPGKKKPSEGLRDANVVLGWRVIDDGVVQTATPQIRNFPLQASHVNLSSLPRRASFPPFPGLL